MKTGATRSVVGQYTDVEKTLALECLKYPLSQTKFDDVVEITSRHAILNKYFNGMNYICIISVKMPTYVNAKEIELLEQIKKENK